MRVDVRLLGPLDVQCAGSAVPLGAPKERVILVLLALHRGRVVPVERLVDVVWGETPPKSATVSVRVLVSRLRKAFAAAGHADVIRTVSPGYLLVADQVNVDADSFGELATRGRVQLAAGAVQDASETLQRALAVWHGERLAEAGAGRLQAEATRLAEARLATLEAWIDAQLSSGRHAALVAQLEELCQQHPMRERLWGQLMLALYRCGRQGEALAVYRQLRTTLADELGLDPSAELRQLEHDVLAQDSTLDLPRSDRIGSSQVQSDLPIVLVPRQLLMPPRSFIGRTRELARLDTLMSTGGVLLDTNMVGVLSGTAGAGKTALALAWAHQAATRFPDGQLYVNLRGFDPDGAHLDPAEALRSFLEALGVPGHRIPTSVDGQSALYRSVLAEKQVLVVLDNALDADQVRPLLPGSAGCAVIVTSRDQLTGLVAAEGAAHLKVNVLSLAEAREMLASRLGLERTSAEPDAVDQIVWSCGRLPLALAVAAARAATTPSLPLDALAAQLADSRSRLDTLAGNDPATNVRSVLSWSYNALDSDAAHLLRRLGLHPSTDLTLTAASSLCGWPVPRARTAMSELARANLTTEHARRRYLLHDLLHAYAREEARRTDSEQNRHDALCRLLDHYLHTAHSAASLLSPERKLVDIVPLQDGVIAEPLHDAEEARDWFSAEQTVLIAAVERATGAGLDVHAYQLARVLADVLERQGHFQDLATVWRAAVAAAERLSNPSMQARAHRHLATASTYLDDLAEAEIHLLHALELSTRVSDLAGQAHAHLDLSWVWDRRGGYGQARDRAQQALNLYTAGGDQRGHATALNAVGLFSAHLGDHQSALRLCQQALAMHQDLGDRDGEADAWDNLGYAHHLLENYREAIRCYHSAIELYRDLGVRYDEAVSLDALGDSLSAVGDSQAAHHAWTQARDRLEELRHADAERVRTKLITKSTGSANRDRIHESICRGAQYDSHL